MGLIEINERVTALGGTLHFGTHTPCGTNLTVEIPLES
jgi:signal transduction histidine kinase